MTQTQIMHSEARSNCAVMGISMFIHSLLHRTPAPPRPLFHIALPLIIVSNVLSIRYRQMIQPLDTERVGEGCQ